MSENNNEIPQQVVGLFDGDTDERPVMVTIRCTTYNQERYIRDALEGFVMQKTNFRFEAIVHDDASTDGTAAIVREYAEKYPDIIKPIYETENQYSKRDGSLRRIMNAATRGKYIASCEGDDYWIDPLKLQKQVDFLEMHPDYSMVFTNAYRLFRDNHTEILKTYDADRDAKMKDIINDPNFITTASICYRTELIRKAPKVIFTQHVGDYPLEVYMAYIGKVRYIHDLCSVYRVQAIGSWTSIHNSRNTSVEVLERKCINEAKMVADLNEFTKFKYNKYFKRYINRYIWSTCQKTGNLKKERKYFFKVRHPQPGYPFKAYVYLLLKYIHLVK